MFISVGRSYRNLVTKIKRSHSVISYALEKLVLLCPVFHGGSLPLFVVKYLQNLLEQIASGVAPILNAKLYLSLITVYRTTVRFSFKC